MKIEKHSLLTLATLLAATLGGTMAFAEGNQTPTPQSPAPQQAPMAGQSMTPDGGMMGQGDMMGGKMDMTQMNRMMENCNKMMERAMRAPPTGSTVPQQKG